MTGFGQVQGEAFGQACKIEIRSVNHRFFESKLRLPSGWESPLLEQEMHQLIRTKIRRGSIHASIQIYAQEVAVNPGMLHHRLAQEYGLAFKELQQICETLSSNSSVEDKGNGNRGELLSGMVRWVASQPGVISSKEVSLSPHELRLKLIPLFSLALEDLIKNRSREGLELSEALQKNCRTLLDLTNEIEQQSEQLPLRYQKRLLDRIEKLVAEYKVSLDPQRMAQEVAILAAHVDIHEELSRLRIHLLEADQLSRSAELSGRALDFLIQEIHRELNTLGSKSQSAEISTRVIAMKTELERMREQVQNVE